MDMQKANISLPEEILQAMELTHESNYTPEQLAAYHKYIDAIRTEKTLIAEAEARGEARGEAKGVRETAKKLKTLGSVPCCDIVCSSFCFYECTISHLFI